MHPLPDWRLALDVADLALGRTLRVDRWLALAPDVATKLAEAFAEVADLEVGRARSGLVTLTPRSAGTSVIIGHPLWGMTEGTLAAEQTRRLLRSAAARLPAGRRGCAYLDAIAHGVARRRSETVRTTSSGGCDHPPGCRRRRRGRRCSVGVATPRSTAGRGRPPGAGKTTLALGRSREPLAVRGTLGECEFSWQMEGRHAVVSGVDLPGDDALQCGSR